MRQILNHLNLIHVSKLLMYQNNCFTFSTEAKIRQNESLKENYVRLKQFIDTRTDNFDFLNHHVTDF